MMTALNDKTSENAWECSDSDTWNRAWDMLRIEEETPLEYTDIHNHTLFGVDDGPKHIEESIQMLHAAYEQGIRRMILTPHYRHGMFPYIKETIEHNFAELKKQTAAEKIGIRLYLGCEYHVDSDMMEHIETGRVHTLADTEYVLTEYSHSSSFTDMKRCTHELIACGYQPVIAHIERYECIAKKPQLAEELSGMGALIQINADSTLGIDGRYLEKVCRKLLKLHLADIIASDAHGIRERMNHMDACYHHVCKKYGADYAAELFDKNPIQITISGDN